MNLSNLIALFVFSVFLARSLGHATLGFYTLLTAILMPFFYFIDWGQSTSLVKEIARIPHATRQIVKNTLAIKVALTAVASLLLFCFSVVFFELDYERKLLWTFSLFLLPRAFHSTLEAALRAHQQMSKLLYINVPVSILLIVGSWLLFRFGFVLVTVLGFLVILEFLKACGAWYMVARVLDLRLAREGTVDWSFCFVLLRRSVPFFAIGILGILHYRLDVVLLAHLKNNAEVGLFSGASNFVNALRFAPSVIVAAFFPAISALRKNSMSVRALVRKTLGLQCLSSAALAMMVFFLAPVLIEHTYRTPQSIVVLKWLVWALIPISLYSTLIYVFYQSDKSRWSLKIIAAAVVLNLGLNLILVPTLGAKALAISRLASESFCLIICFGLYFVLLRQPVTEADHRSDSTEKVATLGYGASA